MSTEQKMLNQIVEQIIKLDMPINGLYLKALDYQFTVVAKGYNEHRYLITILEDAK